jgi:L-serine dehydratase
MFNNGNELLKLCQETKLPIWEIAVLDEMESTGADRDDILDKTAQAWETMKGSFADIEGRPTMGGLIGGEAKKLSLMDGEKTLLGSAANTAMQRAMACSQHNAAMGRICAAPTAGSCGIMPAALSTAAERLGLGDEEAIHAVLTAGAIGKIIVTNATVSGAEGGCQAECGSASAMAAAALVEMAGGSPRQALDAAAIALKNIMGLICDPIAGLVESPCAKRNASGAVNAMLSAALALAGIESIVPFDEVVEAMYDVGLEMNSRFRETAKGGIAATPTGQALAERILK